jgi:hypothetical protein
LPSGGDGGTAPPERPTPGAGEMLAWLQERWVLLAGAALLLLMVWLASGEADGENGRYVLVKDDVPCQSVRDDDGRSWCYLVLDTRTGDLEERARKLRKRRRP